MAKIVKNTTAVAITINDVGITIAASPTAYTIPPQDYLLWASSINVDTYISNGSFIVNDGYDDLKPQNGLLHIHEDVHRKSSSLVRAVVVPTANTTTTLSAASDPLYIFTGTVAGQILMLGDARTYNTGHHYEIWNRSTQLMTIQDNSSNTIGVMSANITTAQIVLQDNTTAAGIWLITVIVISTGIGVATDLTFTRNGGVSQGAYLFIGQTLTSLAGYVISGSNYIAKLSVTNSSLITANKNATFLLQRRTAINTFVDIANTSITIPAGSYSASISGLLIPIGPDWEISAYRVSNDQGGGVNNIVLTAYTVPQ